MVVLTQNKVQVFLISWETQKMELEQIESFYNVFDIPYQMRYGCKYNLALYNRFNDKENYKITCIYDGSYDPEFRAKVHLLDPHYPDLCKQCIYLYTKGIKPDIENYLPDLYKITPYVEELANTEWEYLEKYGKHSENNYKIGRILVLLINFITFIRKICINSTAISVI